MLEEEVAPQVCGDADDHGRRYLPPPRDEDAEQGGSQQVEPAHQRRAEGCLLQARERRSGSDRARDVLERVRRLLHTRRPPDEHDVEGGKDDEADLNRPGGSDHRDRGGGCQARQGDQREARRVLHESVR